MSYNFNGTNQYLSASTAAATAPPIAMSCWFWVTTEKTADILAVSGAFPSGQRFAIQLAPTTRTVSAATEGPGVYGWATTTTSFALNSWHHAFAVWYSATNRKVWLNGGGEGSSTTSVSPSNIVNTTIGAARHPSPFNLHSGRLAEAAIWAGSGVETMGAAEAALLAAGCSALCLTTRLNRLQLYKPLVRDLNWLGIGPVLAAVNSPTVVEQPRMIYPGRTAIGLPPFPSFLAPYRWATAAADASRVRQGWAAVAGAGVGESYPIGEVSS